LILAAGGNKAGTTGKGERDLNIFRRGGEDGSPEIKKSCF
jgi:hypothetical protein